MVFTPFDNLIFTEFTLTGRIHQCFDDSKRIEEYLSPLCSTLDRYWSVRWRPGTPERRATICLQIFTQESVKIFPCSLFSIALTLSCQFISEKVNFDLSLNSHNSLEYLWESFQLKENLKRKKISDTSHIKCRFSNWCQMPLLEMFAPVLPPKSRWDVLHMCSIKHFIWN